MKEYLEILRAILTPSDFSNLTNQLLMDINNKFPSIKINKATEILQYNMSTILIIGIEKAKDENVNIRKIIDWYNICPSSYLAKNNYKEFIEKYSFYIEVIKKESEKQLKNL